MRYWHSYECNFVSCIVYYKLFHSKYTWFQNTLENEKFYICIKASRINIKIGKFSSIYVYTKKIIIEESLVTTVQSNCIFYFSILRTIIDFSFMKHLDSYSLRRICILRLHGCTNNKFKNNYFRSCFALLCRTQHYFSMDCSVNWIHLFDQLQTFFFYIYILFNSTRNASLKKKPWLYFAMATI